MSYLQQSLGDGETIIARAKFHWLYVTAAWLWLLIPGALLLAALSWSARQPADSGQSGIGLTAAAGLLFVIGLFFYLKMMIRKWTTEIGVTSHRFAEKRGLIAMRT